MFARWHYRIVWQSWE